MPELKIFVFLIKSNFQKLWKLFCLIIFFALIANFLTILQPLIFASMMELVIPKDLSILNDQNRNTFTDLKDHSLFDLNFVGAKTLAFINGLFDNSDISIFSNLILLSCIFLAVVIFSAVLNYAANIISKWSNATLTISIRKRLLFNLLNLDYIFFTQRRYGEIISRIIQDSKSVAQGVVPVLQTLFHQGTLILAYSIFLFNTDNIIFFSCFIIFLIQYVIMLILKKPIKNSLINVNNKSANLLASLNEVFSGIRLTKVFNMRLFQYSKLDNLQIEERKYGFRAAIIDELQTPIGQILTSISTVVILFAILFQIQQNNISFQGGVLFVVIGRLIVNPIIRLSTVFTWLISLNASYYKIDIYQKLKRKIKSGKIEDCKYKKEIKVKNCTFDHNKETKIKFGTFSINKGEKIAIVGPSGSGKSTLVDLILRLYDPSKGKILLDGKNIKNFKLEKYRSLFGLIPQEPYLYNDTILNNILSGRKGISKNQVIKFAKLANAHQFIVKKSKKYNTIVGDRGVKLSGGEKQRISIARALVSNPEILIFDEATSALDSKSEKEVQEAINRILKFKTAIIIAHRFSTIKQADKILVFNNHNIEDIGTHKSLIKRSKIYKELYNLQNLK